MSIWSKSNYEGEYKHGWYHGEGTFEYPSGVKYKGAFEKGQFHGEGVLIYPNGGYYKGVWELGKMISGDYFFYDDLQFEKDMWDYCVGDDRRFNYERNNGIKPAGQTILTNNPDGENVIPQGTYDTGDGYYDPIRSLVYSYDSKIILRTPSAEAVEWIRTKCRYNPREVPEPITGEKDQIIMKVLEDMNNKRKLEDYNILEPYKWEQEQEVKKIKAEAEKKAQEEMERQAKEAQRLREEELVRKEEEAQRVIEENLAKEEELKIALELANAEAAKLQEMKDERKEGED